MYIEKIHIDTFGKLSDLNIELDNGVNIIEGANESGKSTIAQFIKFVLYGLNSREREQSVSWRTGGAAGSLTVSAGGKRFRIERAAVGNREAVQLIDADTNMPIRHVIDGITPGEYFLGVNESMFEATAYVSQIDGTSAGGAGVAEGIENILFSADENVNTKRALSKLDQARVTLLHKNGKGGRIFELDNECAELEVKLENASRVHDEILEKEVQLADSKLKFERASEKASSIAAKVEQYETKVLLELYARKRGVEKHIAQLRENIEKSGAQDITELRAMEKMNAKVTNLRHELEEVALREAAESFEEAEDPVLDEYIELGGREALETSRDSYRLKAKVYTIVFVIALLLAIGVGALGLIPLLSGKSVSVIPLIGATVLAVLSLSMVLMSVRARNRARAIEQEYDFSALDSAAAARKTARDAAQFAVLATAEARRRYEEVCEEVRRTYGCEEHMLGDKIEELNEKLRGADSVKAEYDKNISILEQMEAQLSHYTEEELRAKLDDTVDTADIDVSSLPAMRREAEFAQKMAVSLEKYIVDLEKALAGLYPLAQDPIKIKEALDRLKTEREELRRKHAVYALTYEKLLGASESLRVSVSPRLAADAAMQMAHITDGKYQSLGVGANLAMSAETECGTKPLELLSAGTQDAAYLSLRMALISLLYRKEAPVTVYDEAFVRQDDGRLASFMKLISKRGEQSIIFTSNGREASAMGKIADFKLISL